MAYERANAERARWLCEANLPADEKSTVLYLSHKSQSAGSGALAKVSAAYQMTGGSFSPMERQFSGDLMKSKKREEVALRQKPKMVNLSVIKKLFEGPSNNPKSERDVLVIALSFFALLRAGEAAELKWEDVERNGGLLKITIKKAKNDQQGLGRNTFVACPEGEDLDCLLNRWKVRCSTGKYSSEYLFPNLQNGTQLKPNAISTITRKRLGEAGVTATHHALRRGSANEREFRGLSIEEIKARGR
ncbi:hypothetical protein L5515_010203 [Caenorhabditis briggsae]|uniref:Tyr recombinase domain-containing protein n=1 Tax=Caenorhabditis briggsae TaxID=6238 RepID=A0AAE9JDU2_CAEBR|nr:hypothetical protein L5515_010203 [Caenorhabditis briggsae]